MNLAVRATIPSLLGLSVLISFAVTNYACFKDRQELTLVPLRKTDDDEFAFDTGVRRVPRLHRAAALSRPVRGS